MVEIKESESLGAVRILIRGLKILSKNIGKQCSKNLARYPFCLSKFLASQVHHKKLNMMNLCGNNNKVVCIFYK